MAAKRKRKRSPRSRPAAGAAQRIPADPALIAAAGQILAAGLGALTRARQDGSRLFESLVREGSDASKTVRASTENTLRAAVDQARGAVSGRVDAARSQATETLDHLEQLVQLRVHRALHQLGLPSADEVTALTRKVEILNHRVAELIALRTPATRRKQARPTAPRARRKVKTAR
jgi:poly(hydroxyalkanoate) granule-associated protein